MTSQRYPSHKGDTGLPGRDLAANNISDALTDLVAKMYAHPAGETVAPMISDFVVRLQKEFFPNIWNRPKLAKRDRSLVTLAGVMALHRMDQLPSEIERALDNGVSKEEVLELSTTLAFLSGWTATSAVVQEIVSILDMDNWDHDTGKLKNSR